MKFYASKKQRSKAGIAISSENFAPGFDSFEMLPSNGASCGLIIAWKSAVFSGQLVFQNNFALTIFFNAILF